MVVTPSCAARRTGSRRCSTVAASGAGDAVGIFLPMIPETVAALLAIAKLGAVFLPIFSGYGADAVAIRLDDAGAKALVTADGYLPAGHGRADGAGGPTRRWRGAARCTRSWSCRVSAARSSVPGPVLWPRVGGRPFATRPVDSEHPLFIAYTSGTTGRPKGSVHVHGGFLVKMAEEVAFQFDVRRGRRALLVHRHGLDHGPVGGHRRRSRHGATLVLYEGAPDYPGPDRLWALPRAPPGHACSASARR